jgi:hypothetical protein
MKAGPRLAEISETQFTRTDGLDIAYQVVGSPGQPDLLFIPGWVSHLEAMWELPEFARFRRQPVPPPLGL